LTAREESHANAHADDGDDGEGSEAGRLVQGDVAIDTAALGVDDGGAEEGHGYSESLIAPPQACVMRL
jgi:hypothetical protein